MVVLKTSQANTGIIFGIGHDRFLPDSFQLIVYESSSHSTLRKSADTGKYHVYFPSHEEESLYRRPQGIVVMTKLICNDTKTSNLHFKRAVY